MNIVVKTHDEIYNDPKLVEKLRKLTITGERIKKNTFYAGESGMWIALNEQWPGIYSICYSNNKIVGWAMVGFMKTQQQIACYVKPSLRNNKIGTNLVKALTEHKDYKNPISSPGSDAGYALYGKFNIIRSGADDGKHKWIWSY